MCSIIKKEETQLAFNIDDLYMAALEKLNRERNQEYWEYKLLKGGFTEKKKKISGNVELCCAML